MRAVLSTCVLVLWSLNACGGERQSPQRPTPTGGAPVWADEFDRDGLPDRSRWDYEVGFIRNNERQYYTRERAENARVENGLLVIEARRERFEGADYTSASLTSRANWTYGRIEVRARLPKGRGTWPAVWTLGANIGQAGWPACGEIDIMEHVGFDPGRVHANITPPPTTT
jgi:beta-glucanase (GH16 family)